MDNNNRNQNMDENREQRILWERREEAKGSEPDFSKPQEYPDDLGKQNVQGNLEGDKIENTDYDKIRENWQQDMEKTFRSSKGISEVREYGQEMDEPFQKRQEAGSVSADYDQGYRTPLGKGFSYENPDAVQGKYANGPNFVMRDAGGPIVRSGSFQGAGTPQQPKKSGKKQLIAIVLIVALAAGAGFGGGAAAVYFLPGSAASGASGSGSPIVINPDSALDTAEAIAIKVLPSVVGISTKREVTYQSFFGSQRGISEGAGTGVIVDEKGYILTNSHVVNDGAEQEINVQLYDGRDVEGTVLWNDKSLDLAIVKIDADDLVAAELGDSDEVRIGTYAVAIGNPLGNFQWSLTQGVVSGLDRTITVTDNSSATQTTMDGLMQTDASINSGNSGGPLLNSKGEVVGINSAKVQSAEGLGFSIPINTAKPIVDQIKEKGEYTRAYIGISGNSVELYLSYFPNLDLNTESGVYVERVTEGSGAEKAGIQSGDIIVAVDGEEVETMSALNRKLINYRPGDTVTLTIMRNRLSAEIEVTLTN